MQPRSLIFLGVISLGLFPHSTGHSAETSHLKEMHAYLKSPSFMVDRGELTRIDETFNAELTRLTRPRYRLEVRRRAVLCLSLYRTKQSKATLQKFLKPHHKLFPVTVMAYMETYGEDGVPSLSAYLKHRNPKVRKIVAHSFGIFGEAKGLERLAEALGEESDPKVRKELLRWAVDTDPGFFKRLGP